MAILKRRPHRQFFAFLTILSITFTQACPAFALRPTGVDSVPGRGGLEEALGGGTAGLTPPAPSAPRFAAVASVTVRGVDSVLLAEIFRHLSALPPARRNARDMTLEAFAFLRRKADPALIARIPSADAAAAQLDDLIQKSPALGCTTCGAKAAHAILSDPFSNPQYSRPEAQQTPEFQDAELLNAVLLALSIAQNGRLLTTNGADGHLMPASTAADLRDLLQLSEAHPGYPAEAAHEWTGAQMTQAQLRNALAQGQLVVAHVGGNHFVQVTEIMAGRVEYTDPQMAAARNEPTDGAASQSEDGFYKWWKGNAGTGSVGTVLIGTRPGQKVEARKTLPDADLSKVIGCCGINAVFGHFRGVRKILDAVLRLKYRAPDDTGVLVLTRRGLVVRKVQGAPDELILEMIDNPLFPEMLELPNGSRENREAIGDHKKKRREILKEEGLTVLVSEDWQDPGALLNDLFESSLDGLYAGVYTVGIGDAGGLYSGWIYTLGANADSYQALNGPSDLRLKNLIDRWDIAPEFVKLFIRHRLMNELPPGLDDPTRVAVLAAFDRLGDRALKQALTDRDKGEWDGIWKRYLEGRTITIPPDFNRDPVRHVFHLLDQLVGSFGEHPDWAKEVQERFDARRPAGTRQWDWSSHWETEMRYNLPGHAWAALVDWVQDWALKQDLVTETTHKVWDTRRKDQVQRKGFSEGTADLSLLLLIPEIVLGHGRWAMTGDPSAWNGHPQVTTVRAIVHNGAIEAGKNSELGGYDRDRPYEDQGEHIRRYLDEMRRAETLRNQATTDADSREADRIAQAARQNYGPVELVNGVEQVIKTDTRGIVRHWHFIADDYKADLAAGRVAKGLVDMTQPGKLHRPGQLYEDRPVFDRAAAWNRVVQNLRQYQDDEEPDYDEVAHRVAMMELAPGSGIATDGVSLATPFTEFVTSHDRPVEIVIYQKKDAAGNVLYEDYMVTSDQAAGIGLFPAPEVDQAAREIARLEEQMMTEIDQRREELANSRILENVFTTKVRTALTRYVEGRDRIVKGEKIVQPAGPDGKPVTRYRGGFHVQVYHLKGAEKYAKITRRLDENGRQRVNVQVSRFNGESLDPNDRDEAKMLSPVDETVNPALGDRGRFRSFMEKHIAEIPRILLEQVLSYMGVDASGNPITTMDSVLPKGAEPVIEQDARGLGTRFNKDTVIERLGVNSPVLLRHFGAGLEEAPVAEPPTPAEQANRLPGLQRIVLVGVGSSWRDAKVARAIYQELLPNVEILFYDPVEISNRGIKLDPKTDLIIGMSWSGSTDSMVRLFNWMESEGFVTISITGKPDSDMGRLAKFSGGTINVLSGDEQSVATTKGFESVLYSLSLLAVHLSQLQGNPELEETRRAYTADLRRVADEVYGVLSEKKKPIGSRVFDLENGSSTVNRLGTKYRERHKLLWIGSRNMPIHEEGELKGEEIVSSKDKPSMMGLALDIEDSSWQALVTHNYDPKAREEDKVVLGFDMTDPEKFDLFMNEIRQQAEAGGEMIVLTYDAEGNPHHRELALLAAQSEGRIELVVVPQVRPTLQPLINALFYFRFSLALAMQRGMTQQEIDNSRNLAKSVTVSFAQQVKELLLTTRTKVVTILQHVAGWVQKGTQAVAKHLRAMTTGQIWQSITDVRLRAIERLPFVLQRAYDGFFGSDSWLASDAQRQRLEQAFGPGAQGIRQIVIITDEEAAEYAAQASEDPLGSVETIYSGETATKEGRIYTGTMVPVRGYYYRATFDRITGAYTLAYDAGYPQNQGLAKPDKAGEPITITREMGEVTINGSRYEVDSSSFMKDKKKTENLAFGLSLRAVKPDLLGVKVKVFRASDVALDREMQRQDTLFVLTSRFNNFHQQNRVIPEVRGAVNEERGRSDLWMPHLARRSEENTARRAQQLKEHGSRFITLSDPNSVLSPLGNRALGNVALPADLDDTSLYSVTYMGLLSIGVKLGALRGIDTQRYQTAISTVPGLVSALLRNSKTSGRVDRFVKLYGNYKKLQIIGGGQAYADAKEYARVLRTLGIFAEAQLNDSMWHGPLAAYDPNRQKYADPDRRTGINPNFNPRNDALALGLMTDRRFFDTALGGDAQVLDSRNARFALAVKTSDSERDSVKHVGASDSGIFPLGDFPDELSNFVNGAAAQYFALRFAEAHQAALGRPILPPVGGRAIAPMIGPGQRDQEALVAGIILQTQTLSGIQVDYEPDYPETGKTTFVIAAPQGTSGVAVQIMAPFADIDVSVGHREIDRDGISVSVITADLPSSQLNDTRSEFQGRNILQEIEHRVERRVSQMRSPASSSEPVSVETTVPAVDETARADLHSKLDGELRDLGLSEPARAGVIGRVEEAYDLYAVDGQPHLVVIEPETGGEGHPMSILIHAAATLDPATTTLGVTPDKLAEERFGRSGKAAFLLVDLRGMSAPAASKVIRQVEAAVTDIPADFLDRMNRYRAHMSAVTPLGPISIVVQHIKSEGSVHNLVDSSEHVPHPDRQSSLFAIVKGEPRFENLLDDIRRIVADNKLEIARVGDVPDGEEMVMNEHYEGVHIVRVVVSQKRDGVQARKALRDLQALVGQPRTATGPAEARGWVLDQALGMYRTKEGGFVSPEAVSGIDPTAVISNGARIFGADTRIGARSLVNGVFASVENAIIVDDVVIENSVVRTDPGKMDAWAWNDTFAVSTFKSGSGAKTRVHSGSVIRPYVDGQGRMEPAHITNAVVAKGSTVEGGAILNSEIGARNRLVRAKVTLAHTEDNVVVAARSGAPTEISESWIGWGHTVSYSIYGEYLAPNFIRRAKVANGEIEWATVDNLPAAVWLGPRSIFASYDGTGKLGKEFGSSRHGAGVVFPGGVIGTRTNFIMHVHPGFENPADLLGPKSMNRDSVFAQLTTLSPFGFAHRAQPQLSPDVPERPAGEAWGHVPPGAARYGLNSGDFDPVWMFLHARPAIEQMLEEMHRQVDLHAETVGWSPAERDAAHTEVDQLPRYALETGQALGRLAADATLEHKYAELLLQGGPRVERSYIAGEQRYEVRLGLSTPDVETLTLADLISEDPLENDWNEMPLFTPADVAELEGLPAGIEISPNAKIDPTARILGVRGRLGDGVVVPAGATVVLRNASLSNVILNDGVVIENAVVLGGKLGSNVRLTNVHSAGSNLGDNTQAVNVVLMSTLVGDRATLEPYARIYNSTIPAQGIIGFPVHDSRIEADGFTGHHLTARARYLYAPKLNVGGVEISPHNNFSAGAVATGTASNPVVLEGAMVAANAQLQAGAHLGFMSFAKGAVAAGTNVEPFSLWTGTQSRRGYLPLQLPSMMMRFLGKTVSVTPTADQPVLNTLVRIKLAEASLSTEAPKWEMKFPLVSAQDSFVAGKWEFQPRPSFLDDGFGPDKGWGANPRYSFKSGLEENLAQAVPLDQVPVTYPASGAPDFTRGNVKFLFVSLVAGRATRWEKSITDARRESEFTVRDPVSGQPVILSKVLTAVEGVPGFPAGQTVPVGWMPISAAKALGGKAIAIVGHQRELVIREFSRLDGEDGAVSFAEQTELDGTGGALWRSRAVSNLSEAVDLPVVVGAGDQPLFDATFFEQILGALEPDVDLVVGTSTVSAADAQGKGRIVRHKRTGIILGILEQKDISAIKQGSAPIPQAYEEAGWASGDELDAIQEINTGVYSIRVGTMEQALSGVTNRNAQKQFYATDMVSELLKQGKVVSSVDVPAWRMPDVTTVNDLPGVVAALGQHPELKFTAGLEESAGTVLTAPVAFTYTGTPITTVTELKQTLASVSRVSVPAAANRTQQPAFVVAPDGLPKFGTAATIFRPSDSAPIPVDLIARDADHRARILVDLKVLSPQGFDIQVHDLKTEFAGNLGEAIADLEMKQMQAGLNPKLVTAMTGLEEIGRFLGIAVPEGAFRLFNLVASNSNDVWS